MKYRNFILRAVNLVLILGVLWQYQNTALLRADAVAQRQKAIREVEAWNASVLQAQQEAEEEKQAGPNGFGDLITVAVTWKDGKMTDISVLKADGEDKPYYRQAVSVLNEMLEAQSTEVDTVSGATLTANGLIDAVADALRKAAQ